MVQRIHIADMFLPKGGFREIFREDARASDARRSDGELES